MVENINITTIMEFIISGSITVLGSLMVFFLGLFLSIVLPFIALSKVYNQFQKGKEPTPFLYILLGISGAFWGGIVEVLFSLRGYINPFAIVFPIIIGYYLGYICKLSNKTPLIKIIFGSLMVGFIISPIIASFTLPSFEVNKGLIDKAREKATKQNLQNIRKAIIVYREKNGKYPANLDELFKDNTLPLVFLSRKIGHPNTNTVFVISTNNLKIKPTQITDKGGWIYSSNSGDIRINCSHKDSKGVPYYEW